MVSLNSWNSANSPKNSQANPFGQQEQAGRCWPEGLCLRRVTAAVSNGPYGGSLLATCWVAAIFNTEQTHAWNEVWAWLTVLPWSRLLFYPARSFSALMQESQQLTTVTDSSERAGVRSEPSCFSAAGPSSLKTGIGKQSQPSLLSFWKNSILKMSSRHKTGSGVKYVGLSVAA